MLGGHVGCPCSRQELPACCWYFTHCRCPQTLPAQPAEALQQARRLQLNRLSWLASAKAAEGGACVREKK